MLARRKIAVVFCVVALLVFSLGCVTVSVNQVEVGDLETKTETVARGDAESARVEIRMMSGDLSVDGGADDLLNADFAYNIPSWEPEVTYQVEAGAGRLTIRQPSTDEVPVGDSLRYEWDLELNDAVPMDVRLDMGAGQGNLDLGSLDITRLDLTVGAGDLTVDLSGNESLERLEADVGAGQLSIDLRGDWTQDVRVTIQGGFGRTHLRLPGDIGVRVNVSQGIGDVVADGLQRDGNTYVNAVYGTSDVTLDIVIQAGVGTIELESD